MRRRRQRAKHAPPTSNLLTKHPLNSMSEMAHSRDVLLFVTHKNELGLLGIPGDRSVIA